MGAGEDLIAFPMDEPAAELMQNKERNIACI